MIWYWHKGLPPQDGREYPVLLCWDDKYYMAIDSDFLSWMENARTYSCYAISSSYSAAGYSNGGHDAEGAYPKGYYRVEVGYPTAISRNLSDLDFDYNVLKASGSAVSFSLPDLPVMKRIAIETPDPLNGETEEDMADRIQIGIKPSQAMVDASKTTIFVPDETNWLAGYRFMDYSVQTDSTLFISYDWTQTRDFRWFLFPINSRTYGNISRLINGTPVNVKAGSSVDDFMNKNRDTMAWHVSEQDGHLVFSEKGFRSQMGRISYSFDDENKVKNLVDSDAEVILGHSGEIFVSYGNRNCYKYKNIYSWASIDYNTRSKFNFDIYYAEPNLMYFLKSNITVENGQTQNLDGPLVIEEDVKITVKNGGVLSFTDWIVHRGQILIEPGGTMILQPNTTANGYTRNCALISNNKDATEYGRIACDGNIIIMPNCSLAAGGIYGVQLGSGAQIANYGQMVAENWDIYTDYTVEGRDSRSRLYVGYTMSDTGFGLVPEGYHQISELNCLATYLNPTMMRPNNWIYGKSTAVMMNTGTMTVIRENRSGRVTPYR